MRVSSLRPAPDLVDQRTEHFVLAPPRQVVDNQRRRWYSSPSRLTRVRGVPRAGAGVGMGSIGRCSIHWRLNLN